MSKKCTVCTDQFTESSCQTCLADLRSNFSLKTDRSPSEYLDSLIYFGEYHCIAKQYIHNCKFLKQQKVYDTIAKYISLEIGSLPIKSLITYVPSSWLRFFMICFNTSKVLAKNLAEYTKSDFTKVFKRIRSHRSLTTMNRRERIAYNAQSYTYLKPEALKDINNLYLVDDIFTTGSTLDTLAKLAKTTNPQLKITAICFVKTPLERIKLLNAISPEVYLN